MTIKWEVESTSRRVKLKIVFLQQAKVMSPKNKHVATNHRTDMAIQLTGQNKFGLVVGLSRIQ